MNDFIIKMLNLKPNEIETIDTFSFDNTIVVSILLKKKYHTCPDCGKFTNTINDYRQRHISHAILNGLDTTIAYKQRRYKCRFCNKSFPENSPFAPSHQRVSNYTIIRVMNELKNPRRTFSMVANNCHISVSTVVRIFDKHVAVSTRNFPEILCIDEVYAIKYKQKVYAWVLLDFKTSQIYDLLPTRKKYDLAEYFSKIDTLTRSKVKYVSMDMWETYRDLSRIYFCKTHNEKMEARNNKQF